MQIELASRVVRIHCKGATIESVEVEGPGGQRTKISASYFFNSIPITHFFKMLNPPEAVNVLDAARALFYREHITVNVLVDGRDLFPDQWIYVHSPEVRMARIANYNNFSRDMVQNDGRSALSLEYFVFQSDDLWQKEDNEIARLAIDELRQLKLIRTSRIEQTWVVRETES